MKIESFYCNNKPRLRNIAFVIVFSLLLIVNLFFFPSPTWANDKKAVENVKNLIVVAGNIKVKPNKREEFIALSKTFIKPSRSEAGSIAYSFYEDETEKNTFLFFEEWRDQAALDYHFQTPYFQKFVDRSPDLFAEPAQIKIYTIDKIQTL